MHRRHFLSTSLGAIVYGSLASFPPLARAMKPPYTGPKVIVIRFGGGVRRQEVLTPGQTSSPYFLYKLVPEGTLYPHMVIDDVDGLATSHGQGSLNILTGCYDSYQDVRGRIFGAQFEAKVPTLPEYLRRHYDLPAHATLLINGENRADEEYYNVSNHADFGLPFRSLTLSLRRFKMYVYAQQLAEAQLPASQLTEAAQKLAKMRALDRRVGSNTDTPMIRQFWAQWHHKYGDSGLLHARGDRLLTTLALQALAFLRPSFMMINYNDPDYVHWGIASHYTVGIGIIDRAIERLMAYTQVDPFYRNHTIFALVPDCGRDDNRFLSIPYQHHFNSASSRQIFALFLGPGIARGRRVAQRGRQIDVAPTLAKLMGLEATLAQGSVLDVTA